MLSGRYVVVIPVVLPVVVFVVEVTEAHKKVRLEE